MVRTCALLLWSVYILELLFMYSGAFNYHASNKCGFDSAALGILALSDVK